MSSSESDAARVSAINSLLDRGYGKAPQAVDVRGHVTHEDVTAETSPAKAMQVYAGMLADLESDTTGESVH